MIDIELIRINLAETAKNLARRGVSNETLNEVKELDEEWRRLLGLAEEGRAKQNEANRVMQETPGQDKQKKIVELKKLSRELKEQESELEKITSARNAAWHKLPNLVAADVPEGKGEANNKVLRQWGMINKFKFAPKEHWELGKELKVIDMNRAAQVAGARFNYLMGPLVQLQFALIQLALKVLTSEKTLAKIARQAGVEVPTKPFIPIVPPVFIRPQIFERMARLEPRDERYYIPSDDVFLIGSAEHTLGPLHMDEVLAEEVLPLRYLGYSTSFRREAGSYGKDTKGIFRVHQFDKLEIESFTTAENSLAEQEFIIAIQEHLMQQLKVPYRVVANAAGDMSDPDARQIDIEAWLPGQNKYRETHTSDLMTDYQARRLNTRLKRAAGKLELVHMNDATVFAIGRTLIAIMENYQQADGSINVPKVLQRWVGFKTIKKTE
ncbi:MAG: serine--tRNA ligase [Candidatus Andersenbacteria bacterium RIFCSPHIGHO2_12_FULL_46_9]|nr:MAG: Serine-tRNA ligase [Parcubacteria group bacterium GW2011_GWA2_45_14]OGY34783.1 MAG: serine--tRNA ligase [Candidatus Andersenbacteria bacterium RIFCSPHIGHO2_02_FULL_46_16]OGY35918.1 MAG: serine--tRNA ligase [Candidatus Andersenbacteria bacterium RIFCSPHIGHO2_12_FULL_46_9]OGY38138.1 MAG: serine--tRNA ligase [Candidatus Andersenbacteria bacterium RIFCSPLOWO2_02_FULL_46_11]OGY41055.1 MAG: serine--tRNA ligase [Candidatus Andersenbacteria bacterium RIFCSPLOWO2_12_FULL_45_8]HBE90909.1 serine-